MDALDQLSDSDLIRRCLKQDNPAWRALVDRHHEGLRCTICSLLSEKRFDQHTVEDVAQIVWTALLAKEQDLLRRYEQARGGFNTYLRAVAKRVIGLLYRSTGCRGLQEVPLDGHDQADPAATSGLVQAQFAEYQESNC